MTGDKRLFYLLSCTDLSYHKQTELSIYGIENKHIDNVDNELNPK